MADSGSGKPMMVTSSISLKVTAPSFYNQPKKFASVAPPRPKAQSGQEPLHSSFVSTGVLGRVGETPPPSAVCEEFPPPPPPPPLHPVTPSDDDVELPAPPLESLVSDAPPPAFPAPPPVAEDLHLLSSSEELISAHPPPPPPPLPTSSVKTQRLSEKQTSFDRQLGSLTDMLSEMETSGPFNPKMPSKVPPAHTPKPAAPPPAKAPKPALSFVPPPELQDRPPPAPWAEELRARTSRTVSQNAASTHSAAQPPPAKVPSFGSSQQNSQISSKSVCPPNVALPPAAPKTSPVSSISRQDEKVAPTVPSSGKGGAPLTMKEVEDLEKMTREFIVDMDKHPTVSKTAEMCGKCGEALSRSQPAVRAMDKLFHAHCFCCMTCQRSLQGLQFYDRDGAPQCEDCYMGSLSMCSRCGERITDRVLKAVGKCFHAHCFLCTSCHCTLEGAPFITDDDNNPYCVRDYHRRFSPLCVSCNEPIIPDPGSEETVRVVALEKNFHLKCYRCEECARPLSIEADADGCYPLDGRILCMKCHTHCAKQSKQ